MKLFVLSIRSCHDCSGSTSSVGPANSSRAPSSIGRQPFLNAERQPRSLSIAHRRAKAFRCWNPGKFASGRKPRTNNSCNRACQTATPGGCAASFG